MLRGKLADEGMLNEDICLGTKATTQRSETCKEKKGIVWRIMNVFLSLLLDKTSTARTESLRLWLSEFIQSGLWTSHVFTDAAEKQDDDFWISQR